MLGSILRRRLKEDTRAVGSKATDIVKSKLAERSNSLRRKIMTWYDILALYVPGVALLRERDNCLHSSSDASPWDLKIWLPSRICHLLPCPPELQQYEWRMREAEANDALDGLRKALRMRSYLIKDKRDWSVGVSANTRSQTAIQRCSTRIDAFAVRYWIAREALESLALLLHKDETWKTIYLPLEEEDIRGLPMDQRIGEGSATLSWIWFSAESRAEGEKVLHDGECYSVYLLLRRAVFRVALAVAS
jgi:hypothetical protein